MIPCIQPPRDCLLLQSCCSQDNIGAVGSEGWFRSDLPGGCRFWRSTLRVRISAHLFWSEDIIYLDKKQFVDSVDVAVSTQPQLIKETASPQHLLQIRGSFASKVKGMKRFFLSCIENVFGGRA